MSISLKAGWIRGVTIHTGSRSGKGDKYMENARLMGRLLPEAGYKTVFYGDGDAGTMGAVARSAIENGAAVTGVTLKFFAVAQGQELSGANPSRTVDTMHQRMQVMRHNTQAAIALPGSLGTMEETIEWVSSRNHIVKPQIIVSLDGYYDGLHDFLQPYRDRDGDVKRIYIVPTPEDAINKLDELNACAAIFELPHTAPVGEWAKSIIETKHALIVERASLNVMYQLLTRMVSYDVANIPGQTLFVGDVIKPAIFVGDHYNGFKKQFDVFIQEGFVPEERRKFAYFVEDMDVARNLADLLDDEEPLLSSHLSEKHSEGDRKAVQVRESFPSRYEARSPLNE